MKAQEQEWGGNNISPFDQKDAYWLFLKSIFNESSHFSVSQMPFYQFQSVSLSLL